MTKPAVAFSPAQGMAWATAVYLALRIGLLLLATLGAAGASVLALGGLEVVVFGGAAFWLALGSGEESVRVRIQACGLRAPALRFWAVGALVGFCAKFPADSLRRAIEDYWPTPPGVLMAQQELLSHEHAAEVLILFFVVGVLGPLVEELFYRGALFQRLAQGSGRSWAFVLTAFAFVVGHGAARDWPSLALVAIPLTLLRIYSNSLGPPWLAHAVFNSLTLATVVLGHAPGKWAESCGIFGEIVIAAACAATCGFLLWASARVKTPSCEVG